jgi:Bacterial Ig-like domain (group 2)
LNPLRLTALCLLLLGAAASTGGAAAVPGTVGYDVSFPQCGGPFPTDGAFAIVGVNGGRPFSANPCLGAGNGESELAWAGAAAQLYANTADPGPLLSTHWPNGQAAPKPCNTADNPGADTLECHYDYGWDAAADSYAIAVAAYVSLGEAGAGAPTTPSPVAWWLDIESENSWTPDPSRNVAALQGEVDYLRSVGVAQVGIYSTSSAWASITGGTLVFDGLPGWVPGAASLQEAQSMCAGTAFNGGSIQLVQFPLSGFSGDYACPAAPVPVSFTGGPKLLVAGVPSGPLRIVASGVSGSALTATLTSSSAAGRFSTATAGPWSKTLAMSIAPGQTASGIFFYRDTLAGTSTLQGSGPGLAPVRQPVAIAAARPARLVVSPRQATLTIGQSRTFTARVSDAYGNRAGAMPTWSVTAKRVASVATPVRHVSVRVRALAPGRATVRAWAGRAVGTAVLVVRRR